MEWLTKLVDAVSQALTTSPLWVQAPVVMVVAIPMCAALALVWLRVVDRIGAVVLRGQARVSHTSTPQERLRRPPMTPRQRSRKYPQSRVRLALVALLVLVVAAWLVSLL